MFVTRASAPAGANPMGMNLATNFAMTANTAAQVTGWAARAGFGATVITSSKLVADGGAAWMLNAKAVLTAAWPSSTALTLTVMKNATSVATMAIPFNNTTATLTSVALTLASGDTVWLSYTTPLGASATLLSGATNTYLYFT
ncbi:hypothetical protein F5X71_34535 [Nocardia brasiliensis]|uniref:Uncharacterized protein n=1 Tax=Nocardia brasiliensis TaxID=37326 RepID=A0A6G9Y0K6_NOCBR|nr:hypothetical protein [Nocardia brasiliensis]QIS06745.1 hypothetical protein F5X71_34535 [Nocardia brasiliensis]